ncbi:hypothetical protein K505DRAFT_333136 [Melanomma pulvis-pyrius CBS 109.77]|uniref:SRR1-like domain-containing protein n=1 Tax=Melanomma pulvis-pyrius CBS 109.77 TaxID=1314802 RepID=A0A6A6XQJ4_9PLEO|nr:hypothetical protein K505DRAFT_333136 [Melanomma pulvis-pyrius CBS 109.77]
MDYENARNDISRFYKWLDGKPLFKRNMIEAANKLLKQLRLNELEEGDEYQVPDFLDGKQTFLVPNYEGEKLSISFFDYQQFSQNINEDGVFPDNIDPHVAVPFILTTIGSPRHTTQKLCHPEPGKDSPWKDWETNWETNKESWEHEPTSQRLRTLIRKHAAQLENVDRIICFALGSLDCSRRRSYIQHVAACTIRDTLLELPGKDKHSVCILSQDPAFCPQCINVLGDLGIEATTGCAGWLEITENTFVICISPSAPVCQIIADITTESGKPPAAMLCNVIEDEYLSFPLAYRTADGSTEQMVAYKESCVEDDFSDFPKDITFNGRTFTSREDYRVNGPPAAANMAESYPNLPEEALEKLKDEAMLANRRANLSNLGDLKLYVRKSN